MLNVYNRKIEQGWIMKKNLVRQDTIYNYLINDGQLSIKQLAEKLNVTTMTIRRDLDVMEKSGLL